KTMMTYRLQGIVTTALLLLSVRPTLAQGYSSSIAAPYRITPDVTYLKAGAWEAKLDVYSRADSAGPQPTLIWIHGGSSMAGVKETEMFSFLPYLEWGWNVVNLEPRLPGVTLAPSILPNCLCAVRWV